MAELQSTSLEASSAGETGFGLEDDDINDMFDNGDGAGSGDGGSTGHGVVDARHESISLESPRQPAREDAPGAISPVYVDEKGHAAQSRAMLSRQARQAFIDLIYWKRPVATGAAFTGINIFFFLTFWLQYTVLTLLGESLLLASVGSVAYHALAWAYVKIMKRRLVDQLQQYAPVNLTDGAEAVMNEGMNE